MNGDTQQVDAQLHAQSTAGNETEVEINTDNMEDAGSDNSGDEIHFNMSQ